MKLCILNSSMPAGSVQCLDV